MQMVTFLLFQMARITFDIIRGAETIFHGPSSNEIFYKTKPWPIFSIGRATTGDNDEQPDMSRRFTEGITRVPHYVPQHTPYVAATT